MNNLNSEGSILDSVKASRDGISIITIVLNGELFIEETILSVINQKNVKLEYIVIDGGSTDQTLQIISKYNNRINVVISEPDKGIYDAINKGIALAHHDIIGLIHCGDYYEPNILSVICNEFNNTTADVVYGDLCIIETFSNSSIKHYSKANHDLLRKKMSIFHPATFVTRACYRQNGLYNTSFIVAADFDYFLNLFIKDIKFKYIPRVLANFRGSGISSSRFKLLLQENYAIRKNHFGVFNALKYMVLRMTEHLFFEFRKSAIEFLIGRRNYFKLKLLFANKRS